jgi:DNA polymerase-1
LVLEYRQLAKLQSTYIEALPKLVNPSTGRVHTTFNQTVTSTGRLSSTDPNLQNIPIRTELGREIRRAFIAAKADTILLSADYSQIELRIMAHICGDETLVAAFERGVDIHAATAATLFDVPVGEVSRDQRRVAKTVNFGVMYGLGAFGLARRLNIARSEGKEIIDNYFAKYPRIKDYIESTIASTRQQGFASTLLGRRKYYPDIQSANRVARTAAERAAINMPIQGTAADMMKLAMVSIHRAMKAQRLESKMLLQIHEELVFEMPQHEAEILPSLVKSCMESAFLLGAVPVVAELGTGKNWAEAH